MPFYHGGYFCLWYAPSELSPILFICPIPSDVYQPAGHAGFAHIDQKVLLRMARLMVT